MKSPAGTARRGTKGRAGRGRGFVALGLLAFVLVAVGVIWRRSYGFEQARALRDLDRQRLQLEAQRSALLGEIRTMSSREKLQPIAQGRLGMRVPSDSQVVLLPLVGPRAGGGVDGAP